MKKLIRLWVMTKINHSDEYIQTALVSQGIDFKNLSHNEIALIKAQFKQIEADLLIEMSKSKSKTSHKDFDYSQLLKQK